MFAFTRILAELQMHRNELNKVILSTSAALTRTQGFQRRSRFIRVTLGAALNICTCSKPRLHPVCIYCAPSPAGLSGSQRGVKCMQADGESETCRSSGPGSVALTAADLHARSISLSFGKRQRDPSSLGSSQRCEGLR